MHDAAALAARQAVGGAAEIIVQPFIDGKEITIDVFCPRPGDVLACCCRERLEVKAGVSTKARLFDDDTLLRNKLLEEAQELSEAVEPDHVAAEAADVMYFAMVAAVKGGADLEAIERHLNARTLKIKRRPGNSKPECIAAAAAELDAIRAKKKRKVGGE